MRKEEFDAFRGELKQLCASLGKAYTDALGQAYWRALRDVELDDVQAHVERILLNATAETRFPKPSQLRSTPPPSSEVSDPGFRQKEKLAVENLEELRRTNLQEWFNRIGNRKAAQYVRQFGSDNVFFDSDEWCWRRIPR